MTSFGSSKLPPMGTLREVFGPAGDRESAVAAILYQNDIHRDFPAAVEAEAQAAPQAVEESALAGRLDLRDRTIITIDGASSKDLDLSLIHSHHADDPRAVGDRKQAGQAVPAVELQQQIQLGPAGAQHRLEGGDLVDDGDMLADQVFLICGGDVEDPAVPVQQDGVVKQTVQHPVQGAAPGVQLRLGEI